MRQFKNIAELLTAPELIYKYHKQVFKQIAEETGENLENVMKDPFENVLGGDIFLIERFDDLCYIQTTKEDTNGNWMTLLQTSDAFDACEWIGDYVYIFCATNNAGGPSFWIPRKVVDKSNFVRDSLVLTQSFWR